MNSAWNTPPNNTPSNGQPQHASSHAAGANGVNMYAKGMNEGDADGGDVAQILNALWVHKIVIILIVSLFGSMGYFYAKGLKRQYSTTAILSVQHDELLPTSLSNMLGLPASHFEINTHIEVMRSPDILSKLIDELDMMEDPEFAASKTAGYTQLQRRYILIENLRRIITIRAAASASIIKIEVRSIHSLKAAAIANRLADIFIKEHLNIKYKEVQRVVDWMENKRDQLEQDMNKAAEELRVFRSENGLVGTNILQFHNQEFLQLNASILEAEKKYNEAQAKLTSIRSNANKSAGLFSIEDVINSSVIVTLKNDEARKQASLSELSTRYGRKHPKYIAEKAELDSIRSDIHKEIRVIIRNIENDVNIFKSTIDGLKQKIENLKDNFKTEKSGQLVQFEELQQKLETSREYYENFLDVYQQATPQNMLRKSNINVIAYAQPPIFSSYPNKKMIFLLSVFVGLCFGIFSALVLDKMTTTFRTFEDIETYSGFPIYSVVPEAIPMKNSPFVRYVLDKPTSKVAESIRTLRMHLALRAHKNENIQVLNITSSLSHEGKSTISTWFASLCAKAGERVLIIDCDLRRPRLHQMLKLDVSLSLVDYLTDRAELDEVIHHDEASGMDVIPCKATPAHALSLLTSNNMHHLLETVREDYDLIILDSPAASPVSDPYVVAKLSDRTLFIIEADKTPRDVLSATLKKFYDIQYYDIGLIINKTNVKKSFLHKWSKLSHGYLYDNTMET